MKNTNSELVNNNELVKKGKEYKGSEADVAEYNDLFMRGEMGLDTDGQWPSCINVAVFGKT